jgi:three-Cys-motif partner protein
MPVTWTLEPHTAAKHQLLRRYLQAWFPILGKRNRRLIYIDGFAGPGEYAGGEEGSPLLALNTAHQHVISKTLSPDTEVIFLFVESNHARCENLRQKVAETHFPPSFRVLVEEGNFNDHLVELLNSIGAKESKIAPTFAFVDPFGFKGIPMQTLHKLLAHQRCEVVVNLMVDFVNRFIEHPNEDVTSHLPQTFGTDGVMQIPQSSGDRITNLLDLYRHQLSIGAKFCRRFDMKTTRNRHNYSLFFATNSADGICKMKEAMWSVDQEGGTIFSGATFDQQRQTSLLLLEPLSCGLADTLAGKSVPMRQLEQFVIEETDFLPKHLRSVLKQLEARDCVRVVPVGSYKRRKGTYPNDKIEVEFRG